LSNANKISTDVSEESFWSAFGTRVSVLVLDAESQKIEYKILASHKTENSDTLLGGLIMSRENGRFPLRGHSSMRRTIKLTARQLSGSSSLSL
jgi:hypothetical protein